MTPTLLSKFELIGKTALVTGGGTGMGKGFARILAEAGATVMIAARNEDRLKLAAAELEEATGAKIHYRKVDLSDRYDAEKLVHHAQKTMGGLDILVANAASDLYATSENFEAEDYDRLLEVNFTSNVWMTKAAVPAMKKNQWGRIIYITSVVSQVALARIPIGLYAATKSALEAYCRFLAAELGREGININCLLPGSVTTELSDVVFGDDNPEGAAMAKYVSSLNTLNRFANSDEMAGTLLLLASDAGSFINGASYKVDGGWTIAGDTQPDE